MHMVTRSIVLFYLTVGLIAGSAGGVLSQSEGPPTITVGSLSFTESTIVGEMLWLLLEDAGYTAEHRMDLGVSADAHDALVNGEIDVYVEYTGGGLVAILGLPVPIVSGSDAATPADSVADLTYATVAARYSEEYGLVWLDELGFNNSYALAVTRETAEERDITTISELTDDAGELRIATDLEFPDRQDGLVALEVVYGLEFGDVRPGEPELMYSAIANGDVDVITAYTTDGRLPGLDLVLLEDDRHAFPPYHAAPVVDQQLLEQYPEVGEVLNQLAGRIDDATMAELNRQVDVDGKDPRDVARAFLEAEGLLASGG